MAQRLILSENTIFPWTEDQQQQATALKSTPLFMPKAEEKRPANFAPPAQVYITDKTDMSAVSAQIEQSLAHHGTMKAWAGDSGMPNLVGVILFLQSSNVAVVQKIETKTLDKNKARNRPQIETELHFVLTCGIKVQEELDRLANLKLSS